MRHYAHAAPTTVAACLIGALLAGTLVLGMLPCGASADETDVIAPEGELALVADGQDDPLAHDAPASEDPAEAPPIEPTDEPQDTDEGLPADQPVQPQAEPREADAAEEPAASVSSTPSEPQPPAKDDPAPADEGQVLEEAGNIASGTWGTCPWYIDSSGTLVIRPGNLKEVTASINNDRARTNAPWWNWRKQIKAVSTKVESGKRVIAPKSCDWLFFGLQDATVMDLAWFDASQTTSMARMFDSCSSMTKITYSLDYFLTPSLTNMAYMFAGCKSISNFGIRGDMSNVTDMSNLFLNCTNLQSVNLSGLNTAKVTNMVGMFENCGSLQSANLSGLNTSKATDMRYLFSGCVKLSSLDISSWSNASVKSASMITGMFRNTPALSSITVGSSWRMLSSDAFPTSTSQNGWWSKRDGKWLTNAQVVSGRSGIADTYTTYQGSTTPTSKDLSKATITGDLTKGASAWETDNPPITVKIGSTTLKKDTDYYISSWSYKSTSATGTGTYKITVKGKGSYTGSKSATITYYLSGKSGIVWKRLSGETRYDTMVAVSKQGWTKTGGTVVIARGNDYKDALAACGLAGQCDAPVLLTATNKLTDQTKAELNRLKPSRVYIAGGTVAVSDATMREIARCTGLTVGSTCVRVAGSNSCATSAKIATTGNGSSASRTGWKNNTAIIATNKGYKDALSVAPISYRKHWPILLAAGGTRLESTVISALRTLDIKYVYIVGGTLAVTPNVEGQLKSMGITIKGRLAGSNGVGTSREIANWALGSLGMSPNYMGFATSQGFADALTGAALCGKRGSVLLLADDANDTTRYNVTVATAHKAKISQGYVFGGPIAFSERLYNKLP